MALCGSSLTQVGVLAISASALMMACGSDGETAAIATPQGSNTHSASGGSGGKGGGSSSGGTVSTGGGNSTGGNSTGGSSTGGASTGGSSQAGDSSVAGDGGTGGSAGTSSGTGGSAGEGAQKRDVRIAFFGDQANNSDTERALRLVAEEKADLLVVLGDFDYEDNPTGWKSVMDKTLGANFPWIAVGGNHDAKAWSGYQKIIAEKAGKIQGLSCTGTPGDSASCRFHGVNIITSGIGTLGDRNEQQKALAANLKASDATWKVCAWHRNHEDMNTGIKGTITVIDPDFVQIEAYKLCAEHGAMILTGHEHAYSRSLTINCMGKDDPEDHCPKGPFDQVELGPNKTFVAVSGLGGREIRTFNTLLHSDDTWWATYYTKDREKIMSDNVKTVDNGAAGVGSLFIDFGADGNPKQANAYFKIQQNGRVIDRFTIKAQ